MQSKSELKKKHILEKSKEIFIEKGFQAVTMSDIVEACSISRGGLYRYYKSTKDIFMEILQMEKSEMGFEWLNAMENGIPATTILTTFLQEQKKEILHKEQTLSVAIYEFFFIHKDHIENHFLEDQFDSAVKLLVELIKYGIERNEFDDVNPQVIAKNIVLLFEGIRVSSEVMILTDELLDEQLNYMKEKLIKD